MSDDAEDYERRIRPWRFPPPGRLIGRGHPAGDFLEAYDWQVDVAELGHLRVRVHLPDRVRNPRGQLFGGFTPTYVDLISLFTTRAGEPPANRPMWLATTSMRIDYLAPVLGPTFAIDSRLIHRRKRVFLVETRFFDDAEQLLVLAATHMLSIQPQGTLGDG